MSNIKRQSAGTKQAGVSVGGQFAAHEQAQAAGAGLTAPPETQSIGDILLHWRCDCGTEAACGARDGDPTCPECEREDLQLMDDLTLPSGEVVPSEHVITNWRCPDCGDEQTVSPSDLPEIGDPICTDESCGLFDSPYEEAGFTVTSSTDQGFGSRSEIDEAEFAEIDAFVQERNAELAARGRYLAELRGGGETRVRGDVTVDSLTQMDRDGTLPRYTEELLDDFNLFVRENRDTLKESATNGGKPGAMFAAIDVTDFLLRVKEDNAVRDSHFQSGEDTRITDYLNTAIAVTNAPDRETALKRLSGATEYN